MKHYSISMKSNRIYEFCLNLLKKQTNIEQIDWYLQFELTDRSVHYKLTCELRTQTLSFASCLLVGGYLQSYENVVASVQQRSLKFNRAQMFSLGFNWKQWQPNSFYSETRFERDFYKQGRTEF